jgi:hypothetical protein
MIQLKKILFLSCPENIGFNRNNSITSVLSSSEYNIG